jgi:sirohydrochlorin ferrochelatase
MGVLVMAHGGSPEWNETVLSSTDALEARVPTVVAFGMADPATLGTGLDSLASMGVGRVAVVRLFVSGASFLPQTLYLLGLSDERPAFFMTHAAAADEHAGAGSAATASAASEHVAHGGAGVSAAEPAPLSHGLLVATHELGLMGSDEASAIMADRAGAASIDPASESVLLIAHGMGEEDENDRLLAAMDGVAAGLRDEGFARVDVMALREDWPEKRQAAEDAIRDFVAGEANAGRRVLVVPFRLSGFGPYAAVLEGLDYVATEGLLPHAEVGRWVERTAREIACARQWENPLGGCR